MDTSTAGNKETHLFYLISLGKVLSSLDPSGNPLSFKVVVCGEELIAPNTAFTPVLKLSQANTNFTLDYTTLTYLFLISNEKHVDCKNLTFEILSNSKAKTVFAITYATLTPT